jgi:hypothetical protein
MPLAFLSTIVPDVVADATNSRFAMCSLADDGELRIGLVAPDQTASATELRVPRYSDAPIVSCRLALGSSGALGVSWEEYSAPGYSVYFGTVPLPR